ncbi:MAG: hypothetical protein L0K27_02705 [Corynebacterium nuruki]|nr:hypothetical protein [Corynebacterium nuruki]
MTARTEAVRRLSEVIKTEMDWSDRSAAQLVNAIADTPGILPADTDPVPASGRFAGTPLWERGDGVPPVSAGTGAVYEHIVRLDRETELMRLTPDAAEITARHLIAAAREARVQADEAARAAVEQVTP